MNFESVSRLLNEGDEIQIRLDGQSRIVYGIFQFAFYASGKDEKPLLPD